MNAAQRELVQTDLRQAGGDAEVAGALFYERLFAKNPGFRPLFKNNMRVQGLKLMTMLAMVRSRICANTIRCRLRSVISPFVMSSMASSSLTTTPCGKRSSGPSHRC